MQYPKNTAPRNILIRLFNVVSVRGHDLRKLQEVNGELGAESPASGNKGFLIILCDF